MELSTYDSELVTLLTHFRCKVSMCTWGPALLARQLCAQYDTRIYLLNKITPDHKQYDNKVSRVWVKYTILYTVRVCPIPLILFVKTKLSHNLSSEVHSLHRRMHSRWLVLISLLWCALHTVDSVLTLLSLNLCSMDLSNVWIRIHSNAHIDTFDTQSVDNNSNETKKKKKKEQAQNATNKS